MEPPHPGPSTPRPLRGFAPLAARVRLRLALRAVVAGLAGGLVFALPVAVGLWLRGHAAGVLVATVPGALGGLVGAWYARRRRWSDSAVALFLDARLGSHECIATALETTDEALAPARRLLQRRAEAALAGATDATLPRVFSRHHAAIPACVAALLVLAAFAPGTQATAGARQDPPARVRVDRSPGLEAVEALAAVRVRDPAQRARLQALAAQARALRESLREGMEPAAARQAVERLRERVAAERARFGQGAEARGLSQAAAQLAQAGFESAARALQENDLASLDRELERLANAREASDRQRARQALAAAAEAASQAGDQGTADLLREQESLLRQRSERNGLLRSLARQLGQDPAVRRQAQHLDRNPNDTAARALAQALEEALSRLSQAERQRLTQRLREAAARPQDTGRLGQNAPGQNAPNAGAPMSAAEVERMLRELLERGDQAGTDGAGEPGGEGAAGGALPIPVLAPGGGGLQRGLDRAMDGAGQASRQLGTSGRDGPGQQGGEGGVSRGGGPGDHGGATSAVGGEGLRSRAGARIQRGTAQGGSVSGLAPASAGGVARTVQTGDLRSVAPSELQGVERADIPTEYREQVRVYFQP